MEDEVGCGYIGARATSYSQIVVVRYSEGVRFVKADLSELRTIFFTKDN